VRCFSEEQEQNGRCVKVVDRLAADLRREFLDMGGSSLPDL
jgi:hypothetical protein